MSNDAYHAICFAQTFDCVGYGVECLWVECTEALVNEQAVEADGTGGLLYLFAEFQC